MMDIKYLKKGRIIVVLVLIFASLSSMAGHPAMGDVNHHTTSKTTVADARWSADVGGDGIVEARGWISYTLEKGIAGRIIIINGAWGTDDGNLSGSLTIKNIIFIKSYGTYRGVFTGSVSGADYTAKFTGFLRNDWEVGYWKIIIPATIHVQVVHIPFN